MGLNGKQRVLISPMAWGLGHATRVIPIIHELQKKGHSVTLATNDELAQVICSSCPNVEVLNFYSPKISLGKGKSQLIPLLLFLLRLPYTIYKEKRELRHLLTKYRFDLTISDNRYGFRSKDVESVIITHQLLVLPPKPFGFTRQLGERLIRYLLSGFNQVWVPDTHDTPSIAGILSESNCLSNVSYIGAISRFAYVNQSRSPKKWDVVVLVSGPEPQRSIFVELCIKSLSSLSLKSLIIEGRPTNGYLERTVGNISVIGSLDNESMVSAILSADLVVARSGYSTIMDLLCLERAAVLVPTPGQTEQEYLANRMRLLGWFYTLNQEDLSSQRVAELLEQELPIPPKFGGKPLLNL